MFYESDEFYFNQDVDDNFCILKRNIEIQIENIKSVMQYQGISKAQIKDLGRSLEDYGSLSNRTKNSIINFKNVFGLMDSFDDLTRRLDEKLSKIESLPILLGIEEFVEMYGDEYYRHLSLVCLN